eukprot:TRINITY_DN3723_c1_g1_i1.p1 TRINITY_DN3723_c1_g1~~TRINITY_DN3723_c1_g1_i1.p1  ORF type:complete len:271 (-),score=73.21 TRINITY_DN3723_c1_g1_i1:70-882(-)
MGFRSLLLILFVPILSWRALAAEDPDLDLDLDDLDSEDPPAGSAPTDGREGIPTQEPEAPYEGPFPDDGLSAAQKATRADACLALMSLQFQDQEYAKQFREVTEAIAKQQSISSDQAAQYVFSSAAMGCYMNIEQEQAETQVAGGLDAETQKVILSGTAASASKPDLEKQVRGANKGHWEVLQEGTKRQAARLDSMKEQQDKQRQQQSQGGSQPQQPSKLPLPGDNHALYAMIALAVLFSGAVGGVAWLVNKENTKNESKKAKKEGKKKK